MRISDWSSDVCSSDLHRQIMPGVVNRAVTPEGARMLGDNLFAAAHDDAVGIGTDLHRAPRHRRENRVAVAVEADQAGARHRMQIGRAPSDLPSLMRISYAVFCLHKQVATDSAFQTQSGKH